MTPNLSVKPLTDRLTAKGDIKGLGPLFVNSGRAFDRLETWANAIRQLVDELRADVDSITFPTVPTRLLVTHFQLLTSNFAVDLPSDPPDTVHLYMFRQDGTGGWTVTFPNEFQGAIGVSPAADSITARWFFKESEDLYYPCAPGLDNLVVTP